MQSIDALARFGALTRRTIATAAMAILAGVAAAAGAQQTAAPADPTYEMLRDRVIDGDDTVDFTALRTAFMAAPEYHPDFPMIAYRMLWSTLNTRDFARTLEVADRVLMKDFVDVNAHMVAALAHRELGNTEREKFHRRVADGLLASIRASGDGKTADTAFKVIATSEEYALVVRSMGLRVKSVGSTPMPPPNEAPSASGERFFIDAMHTVDPRTNIEATYFFRVPMAKVTSSPPAPR